MTEHEEEHLVDFRACVKNLEEDPDPAHEADILLLTCMDFRFFLTIAEIMEGKKYDHVILAGAALGVVQEKWPHWGKTYFDHLGLAVKLHKIHSVWVMEHRDCGAYGPKGFGLLPANPDRKEERKEHMKQVREFAAKIPRDLHFKSFLLEAPKIKTLTFDQLIGDD